MKRLYRLAIRLLPAAFRAQYAEHMAESFDQRCARFRGIARARFIAAAFLDVLATVTKERTDGWFRPRRSGGGSDLRFAARAVTRRPGFAVAVIGTLAIGVGANVAVFSLVEAVLWKPLRVDRPDRVVELFTTHGAADPGAYGLDDGLSYSAFRRLEATSRTMTSVAGFIDVAVGFDAAGDTRQLTAGAVSGRYFSLLGVRPQLGRLIGVDDDRPGADHIVVLSDRVWTQTFGRSAGVLGRTVRIGGTAFEVVGVAQEGFRGTRLADTPAIWVPMPTLTEIRAGGIWNGPLGRRMLGDHPLAWVSTLGRLDRDASVQSATDEARAMFPEPPHTPGELMSERAIVVRPLVESAALVDRPVLVRLLAVLSAVVGLTLIIACMNIANLTWARAAERSREFAIRTAIGASRSRLVRQLLCESLLLALAGALAALGIGAATVRLLAAFALPGGIRIDTIGVGVGPTSALVAGALAVLSALVIGLRPAIHASRPQLGVFFRGVNTLSARPAGWSLIAGQVAATLVLLVTAMLFLRSLQSGLRTDIGFNYRRLAAVSVDLFRYGYDRRTVPAYYRDALARAASLPGVTGAALTSHLPLASVGTMAFNAPGSAFTQEHPLPAGIAVVTPDFFRVIGVPIVAGRTFTDTDAAGAPAVAVLNAAAARAFFDGASAIGREIRLYGAKAAAVVGVAGDGKYASVTEHDRPMVYLSFFQELPSGGVSIVTASAAPAATLPALKGAIQSIDEHVALYDARLVATQIDDALAPQRFGTALLGLFASVGLAVAALGIFSVVSCSVVQRTPELGLRRALGAGTRDVLRLTLGRTGAAVASGFAIGIAAAGPAAKALEAFMVGVSARDVWAFGGAAAVLAAAALAAVAIPARRALRADPIVTLRSQ